MIEVPDRRRERPAVADSGAALYPATAAAGWPRGEKGRLRRCPSSCRASRIVKFAMSLPPPAMNMPAREPTACPSCAQAMTRLDLPQKNGGSVALDLCFPCQGIWFDAYESAQISPAGIIDLFKLIHAHGDEPRRQISAKPRCPRCKDALIAGLDLVRGGRFTYHRCLQNHGRFTMFAQFMIEKGFVRQLAPAEVRELAAKIGTVHCTGCGAPIDIRSEAACPHCASPISILDAEAVEKALADYQQKAVTASAAHTPEALGDALIAIEKQRSHSSRPVLDIAERPVGDLLLAGVGMVLALLR
jgi:hypothetical protein